MNNWVLVEKYVSEKTKGEIVKSNLTKEDADKIAALLNNWNVRYKYQAMHKDEYDKPFSK